MIDSINPRNLLDFSLEVAAWIDTRRETLETELEDVERVITTFCSNNDDPIYQGANIIASQIIAHIVELVVSPDEETKIVDPLEQTEKEVENGGNSSTTE